MESLREIFINVSMKCCFISLSHFSYRKYLHFIFSFLSSFRSIVSTTLYSINNLRALLNVLYCFFLFYFVVSFVSVCVCVCVKSNDSRLQSIAFTILTIIFILSLLLVQAFTFKFKQSKATYLSE